MFTFHTKWNYLRNKVSFFEFYWDVKRVGHVIKSHKARRALWKIWSCVNPFYISIKLKKWYLITYIYICDLFILYICLIVTFNVWNALIFQTQRHVCNPLNARRPFMTSQRNYVERLSKRTSMTSWPQTCIYTVIKTLACSSVM